MKKFFKIIGLGLLSILLLFTLAVILFLNLSPEIGGTPTDEQKELFAKSGHYEEEQFVNTSPVLTNPDANFWTSMQRMFADHPNLRPESEIVPDKVAPESLTMQNATASELIWFGHSTFLLQMDGKNILLDPMFGQHPAPIALDVVKRFNRTLPIEIEQLPFIDAVLFSHDHYDHLDYESVLKLKDKVGKFFVPLGLGAHLLAWGVNENNIVEMNWWDETNFEGIKLVAAPAKHFSGRGLLDASATFWCSWVIEGQYENLYFSGDSGYDTHFKEIGDKYGPFDLALLECGQYDVDWPSIHMMPEETAQAGADVKAKACLPIHWGAFTLAFHTWTDPVERFIAKGEALGLKLALPKVGEVIQVAGPYYPTEAWWKKYQ